MPKVDLFATLISAQLSDYVSWKPDPSALHTNGFTLTWSSKKLCLSPLQYILSSAENSGRRGDSHDGSTFVANTSLVSNSSLPFSGSPCSPTLTPSRATTKFNPHTSSSPRISLNSNVIIRKSSTSQGLSSNAARILLRSWRTSTRTQYWATYQNLGSLFCLGRKINPFQPPLNVILDYLLSEFKAETTARIQYGQLFRQ